jgi:hypothetical protein
MTKGELLELLDPLGWDDHVYLDFGDGMESICEVDSGVEEIEGIGKIGVLSICLTHDPEEMTDEDAKMEDLINKQKKPNDN